MREWFFPSLPRESLSAHLECKAKQTYTQLNMTQMPGQFLSMFSESSTYSFVFFTPVANQHHRNVGLEMQWAIIMLSGSNFTFKGGDVILRQRGDTRQLESLQMRLFYSSRLHTCNDGNC